MIKYDIFVLKKDFLINISLPWHELSLSDSDDTLKTAFKNASLNFSLTFF